MDDPSYALDELGWLQFDRLCRLIVAEAFKASPPAWSGRTGHGRAMVLDGPVTLPGRARSLSGPVSLVVAWVPPLDGAWNRATALVERVTEAADAIELSPNILVLTNLARADARDALRLAGFARDWRVSVLGREDVGRLLDDHATLRLAMPSVLGMRGLGPLIPDALAASSFYDLDGAAELARVFWPTEAYERAREVLARHRFVVLTGPPEMGKTAIARMLALALMTDGFSAHECTQPNDVFRALDPSSPQVFIADDAFGSTEYRPDAGERWAQAMSRLLPRLDDRHWLIWTSRPAPLKAGLRRLQRERGAEQFPAPGEVTVDASDLSLAEKTLILFRHAKASQVLELVRAPIQRAGVEIVEHPHFTPERIRRLVAMLPEDGRSRSTNVGPMLARLIATPTEAMRNSYRALGEEHRLLLMSLLDAPAGMICERELAATVRRHAEGGLSRPPGELIDRLTDHFLRITSLGIGWVHPSWRDLVIDELRTDAAARARFLRTCGVDGILLALSTEGGVAGERYLPLMLSDGDWDALGDRVATLLRELDDLQVMRLLLAAGAALEQPILATAARRELAHLASSMLDVTSRAADTGSRLVTAAMAEAWYELRHRIGSSASLPVGRTWIELRPSPAGDVLDVGELERMDDWLALAQVLDRHDVTQLSIFQFQQDQALLARIALTFAMGHVVGDGALVRSVLDRIAQLFPGLAADACAVARVDDVRRAVGRDRWWTPSDIDAPPSGELAVQANAFEHADVRRVLEDL